MSARLTSAQRARIADEAARRYNEGATWAEIAADHQLSSAYVRRLAIARHDITYRRWGQQAVVNPDEAQDLHNDGKTLEAMAKELGCSRQAIRTALEAAGRSALTRYPKLSTKREPSAEEVRRISRLYETCPQAPRSRKGSRNVRGTEGRALAAACLEVVLTGVPMSSLSRALDRGPTWVHWLLSCHEMQPPKRRVHTTSRRTRETA